MSNVIPSEIYDLLSKIVDGDINDFTISEYDKNEKGEGFLGDIYFISLQNKKNKEVLNFAVKQAFSKEELRQVLNVETAYKNEINFYSIIWPRLKEFQMKESTLVNFDKIPKYFASIADKYSEKIIFENLKPQGFEAFNKTKCFDKQHAEMICKTYGKFHAISFAYQKLHPEEYLELSNLLKDVNKLFSSSEGFKDYMNNFHKMCLPNLNPGEHDKIIEKYKPYVDIGTDKYIDSLTYKGKYPIIVHGDCWSNNLMFKYDEFRNLIDIRILDFQLAKSGTPVFDLSYCLYAGASKDILDKLDDYLKIYHNSLSETLRKFGCNPEELYPFDTLKSEWKQYSIFGFSMALMLWKIKLTYQEEVIDYDTYNGDQEEFGKQWTESKFDEEAYKKATNDLIIHFYEYDCL